MSAPKFLNEATMLVVEPEQALIGETIWVNPASFAIGVNSSAPISGVVVFLVSPSISVVIPPYGIPVPFNIGLVVCKSVLLIKAGLIETECAFRELAV